MIKVGFKGVESSLRRIAKIERNVDTTSEEFLQAAAEYLVGDLHKSWSSTPQTVGSKKPPAIKTTNLDSSIKIGKMRNLKGQFGAGAEAKMIPVTVDTTDGDKNNGRGSYQAVLEDIYDLPFFQPAVDRLAQEYEGLAKRYIKT